MCCGCVRVFRRICACICVCVMLSDVCGVGVFVYARVVLNSGCMCVECVCDM